MNITYEFVFNIEHFIFLEAYSHNFNTNGDYLGTIFDVIIKVLFNIDIKNIYEGLKIFGV